MDENIKNKSADLESLKAHFVKILEINNSGHLTNTMRDAIGKAYQLGLTTRIVSLQEENKHLKEQLKDE